MQKDTPARLRIIETMCALLQEKPLDKITVKEIVSESGTSLGTFYRHYRDKYDLAARIWDDAIKSCWYDDGKPLGFHDFLIKRHAQDHEQSRFLRNAFAYAGTDSLWTAKRNTLIECLVDFVRRCEFADQLDDAIIRAIELYATGLCGIERHEYERRAVLHEQIPELSPEERADEEIGFIPEQLRPYLLAEPKY